MLKKRVAADLAGSISGLQNRLFGFDSRRGLHSRAYEIGRYLALYMRRTHDMPYNRSIWRAFVSGIVQGLYPRSSPIPMSQKQALTRMRQAMDQAAAHSAEAISLREKLIETSKELSRLKRTKSNNSLGG